MTNVIPLSVSPIWIARAELDDAIKRVREDVDAATTLGDAVMLYAALRRLSVAMDALTLYAGAKCDALLEHK